MALSMRRPEASPAPQSAERWDDGVQGASLQHALLRSRPADARRPLAQRCFVAAC